jgi:hypothetical protein
MSSDVYPAMDLLDVDVSREVVFKSQIFENPGGTEQRVSLAATPRYRYTLKYSALRGNVAAPSPWQAYSEIGAVLHFIEAHLGAWDSFRFYDPMDGAQRRVRFEEDTLSITRVASNIWAVSFNLITAGAW